MILKERLAELRSTFGAAESDAVVTALKAKLGHFPTLRAQVEALERESGPARTTARQSFPAKVGALELCTQYDALTSDQERRAFYSTHSKAVSKIGGLAEICMAAGKRLSSRARSSVGLASLDQRAGELLEAYRRLDDPKERAHFWREHRETLEKSKFAEGTLLHFIAAGKPLSGHALMVFGMMKEQENAK
jgi:hypothetical protein